MLSLNLSSHRSMRAQLMFEGMLKPLVQLCQTVDNVDVLCGVISVVQNMSLDEQTLPALVDEQVLDALVPLITRASSHPVLLATLCGAFVKFAQHEISARKLISIGIVRHLCDVCTQSSTPKDPKGSRARVPLRTRQSACVTSLATLRIVPL